MPHKNIIKLGKIFIIMGIIIMLGGAVAMLWFALPDIIADFNRQSINTKCACVCGIGVFFLIVGFVIMGEASEE